MISLARSLFATLVVALLATLVAPDDSLAGGGLGSRRLVCGPVRCAPHVAHAAPLAIVDHAVAQVIAAPQIAYPAAPIIVQNNYPAAPIGIGSTVYGYADPATAALQAAPYRVDPAQILREAARLTDGSQQLTREALTVYRELGTDALGVAAQAELLRAQAALIEATKPDPLPTGGLVPAQLQTGSPQRLVSGGQTICITPDGAGGFSIRVEPGTSASTPEQLPAPAATHDAAAATDEVPPGVRVLQSRCAACHTGAAAKGGLVLFTDPETFAGVDRATADRILESVRSGAMPPPKNAAGEALQPLTDVELAQLQILLGG
jgi:mono/diheme cytochrome c family protein